MAGRGSKRNAQSRSEAERARLYTARAEWHERGIRRRVRDNMIAVVAGALLVIGAFASQAVHASVTAPPAEAEPTESVSPEPAPAPEDTAPSAPAPEPTADDVEPDSE